MMNTIQSSSSSSPPAPEPSSPLSTDVSQELAPLPEYKSAGTTTLDFGALLSDAPLQLHEDLRSGCGGQLWPAGMVLATHMLRYHRERLLERGSDTRILELGAGGGLVSLALARGFSALKSKSSSSPTENPHPPRLLVTDQQEMLSLMKHNIALNGVERLAKAMVLNWGEALPPEVVELRPDVILAADCVYFEPAFPLLLATMSELMSLCPTASIYFCFKKRRRADMQFLKKAKKTFCVTEMFDQDRPVFSREGLFLYLITSKNHPSSSTSTSNPQQEQPQQQSQQQKRDRPVKSEDGDS